MNGKCGQVDWIALVQMEAPLHGDDVSAGEATANELSPVTGCRAFGEERNLFIREYAVDSDFVGNLSSAGSQDNTESGARSPLPGDMICCFLDYCGKFQRRRLLFKRSGMGGYFGGNGGWWLRLF